MNEERQVIVRCPNCHQRVIDKEGKGNVTVHMKCPHCKHQISINLALRLNRGNGLRYRIA